MFNYLFIKNILDRIFSFVLIILFIPLFLVLGFSVYLFMGFPIFFVQPRAGLHAIPFPLYKFRSMKCLSAQSGELLPDSQRLTFFGSFLRSTSLDELPSLVNVLFGDMSFIGPRPLLVDYLPLYSTHQARRHNVKPGITGLAQISGRNLLGWTERFNLDIWYVEHQCFFLDFRILVSTPFKVLSRQGISAAGQSTMVPFTGGVEHK